jgi:hypothetical protein
LKTYIRNCENQILNLFRIFFSDKPDFCSEF